MCSVQCDLVLPQDGGKKDLLRTEGSVWEVGVRSVLGKRRKTSSCQSQLSREGSLGSELTVPGRITAGRPFSGWTQGTGVREGWGPLGEFLNLSVSLFLHKIGIIMG